MDNTYTNMMILGIMMFCFFLYFSYEIIRLNGRIEDLEDNENKRD